MKTNEAPEKIYLCPSELAGIDYDEEWYDRPFGDSIEYTRTDAFIEKACAWYRTLDDKEPPYTTTEKFIEGFKKAMKL